MLLGEPSARGPPGDRRRLTPAAATRSRLQRSCRYTERELEYRIPRLHIVLCVKPIYIIICIIICIIIINLSIYLSLSLYTYIYIYIYT